jgi:hypothetical protein
MARAKAHATEFGLLFLPFKVLKTSIHRNTLLLKSIGSEIA